MKKLIASFAVVACVACANAASFTWSMTNIMDPVNTTEMAGTGWAAAWYDNSSGTALATITGLLEAGKLADAYNAATYTASTTALGTAQVRVASAGNGSYSQGESATGFMVVFSDSTPADADYYLITDSKSSLAVSPAGSNISIAYGAQSAFEWQSVPEPTSGLLLLIGVAGLALRRRRA